MTGMSKNVRHSRVPFIEISISVDLQVFEKELLRTDYYPLRRDERQIAMKTLLQGNHFLIRRLINGSAVILFPNPP
jgi:hypothetical protein